MTQRNSSFGDEFAIIPWFMYWLAVVTAFCLVGLFVLYMPMHDPKAPHQPWLTLLALLIGTVAAAYLLLLGYVNQDAKRRDMGQLLWTLLVIFIPNGIGFLAYFLLRKPIIERCPQCGERVEKGFHYCTKCGCALTPACPHCGQTVQREYTCCPSCGKALVKQTA